VLVHSAYEHVVHAPFVEPCAGKLERYVEGEQELRDRERRSLYAEREEM
jgi:hypothetical protein